MINSKPADGAPVTQHSALFLVGDSLMKTGTGTGATGFWGYGEETLNFEYRTRDFEPLGLPLYRQCRHCLSADMRQRIAAELGR